MEALLTNVAHADVTHAASAMLRSSSPRPPASPRHLAALLEKLEKLSRYPDNWDDDGSEAPNALAVARARQALQVSSIVPVPPLDVLPSAENGIAIVWEVNGRYADIEFFNSGEMGAVTDSHVSTERVTAWELRDLTELEDSLRRIGGFLRG